MAFCPNCSAELVSPQVLACENCEASFAHADGWRPTAEPTGTFVPWARKSPRLPIVEVKGVPQSLESKVWRWILATPLLLVGAFIFRHVPLMDADTLGLVLLFALLFTGTALFVLLSRPGVATGISVFLGVALLLATCLLLLVLNGLTFAR
jgi:hypothetical protein